MVLAKITRFSLIVLAVLLLTSCAVLDFFKPKSQENETGQTPPAQEMSTAQGEDSDHSTGNPGNEAKNMSDLEDKVAQLENKVTDLETQVAEQKKVVYTIEYSDPAQLYQKARTLLLAGETDNAADLFSTFAKAHPDHALADNAMYWLGECHYSLGRYQKAIIVFKALVKTYPKAAKVPDALLKTGYAYLSLDDINRANHFLKLVLKKYPFSPAGEKAQDKLKEFN